VGRAVGAVWVRRYIPKPIISARGSEPAEITTWRVAYCSSSSVRAPLLCIGQTGFDPTLGLRLVKCNRVRHLIGSTMPLWNCRSVFTLAASAEVSRLSRCSLQLGFARASRTKGEEVGEMVVWTQSWGLPDSPKTFPSPPCPTTRVLIQPPQSCQPSQDYAIGVRASVENAFQVSSGSGDDLGSQSCGQPVFSLAVVGVSWLIPRRLIIPLDGKPAGSPEWRC
jgi:hypothetical protein